MDYFFAPMEGVTGGEYRRIHQRFFPGIDAYYMPFLTPTRDWVFTTRDLRNILPEHNRGFRAVPQLLTRDAGDFLWCAGELAAMGYDEVNLNLGCPSGTVTAKGKGAGLLADLEGLERLLDGIFEKASVAVSIKSRIGWADPEEFPRLLELFARYPAVLLIIHPRVRQDFYRRPVREEYFARAAETYPGPLCFNGGLTSAGDCTRIRAEYPEMSAMMLGQGLLANPALVRQAKGGPGLNKEELRAFHDALYRTYLDLFSSQRNAVFHMKELWSYLGRMFADREKPMKRIRKAADSPAYKSAVAELFAHSLRENADWN